jgi:sensor histidine kinase YesM
MKKMIIHNPFFRLLTPPVYGILVYLMILLINNEINQLSGIFIGQEVYVCIGLSFLMAETLRLNAIIFRKYNLESFGNKILLQSLTGLALAMLVVSFAISSYFKILLDFSISDTQLIIFNCIFGVSSLLYNLLYFSHLFLHKQNIELLNEEQLLTDLVESELSKFKHEINPNLLYDSLETLITLVHKSTDESEDYIDHLSSIYRYILSNKKTELTTVKEEIKAAKNIIHLLNYKHGNHIKLQINLPDDQMGSHLVPGTLPNLVERAIRTTIISGFSPLIISLEYEQNDGYIFIEYKLNERLNLGSDTVFDNIQQSYTYYSEKPVVQVRAYDKNYVKIPLLEVMTEPLTSKAENMTE